MKNLTHRIAKYTALVLISAMPFSVDVLADSDKEQSEIASLNTAKKDLLLANREVSEEGNE